MNEKNDHKKQKVKLQDDNIYIKKEIGFNDGVLMSNGKKTLVSRVELPRFKETTLIDKYPEKYKKHCNLFNEKEFEEKEPEIFAECCDIKHSARLLLPKFQAV
jgi:hypothetical protein